MGLYQTSHSKSLANTWFFGQRALLSTTPILTQASIGWWKSTLVRPNIKYLLDCFRIWGLIESIEPVNDIILFVRNTFTLGRWSTFYIWKCSSSQIYKHATDLRKEEFLLAFNIDLYSGLNDESSALISFH